MAEMNTKGTLSDGGICPPDPTDKNLQSYKQGFIQLFKTNHKEYL
jgi:hypothetical protein